MKYITTIKTRNSRFGLPWYLRREKPALLHSMGWYNWMFTQSVLQIWNQSETICYLAGGNKIAVPLNLSCYQWHNFIITSQNIRLSSNWQHRLSVHPSSPPCCEPGTARFTFGNSLCSSLASRLTTASLDTFCIALFCLCVSVFVCECVCVCVCMHACVCALLYGKCTFKSHMVMFLSCLPLRIPRLRILLQ